MIAVLGTGSWGSRIIDTLERMDIPYVCCNTRGEHAGKTCFSRWQTMLARHPDGLIIAADPAINLQVMQRAARLKIPVMVEKPAALNIYAIHQMAALPIPILVDYIHLFNPHYQELKRRVNATITSIWSLGFNHGPFRHYSGLYDYGPHDLAMCMDLLPERFVVDSYRVTRNGRGHLYNLRFGSGGTQVHILTGNGATDRGRRLTVSTASGDSFSYEDNQDAQPLNRVINHFLEVIDGKPVYPSFDLTIRIHTALDDLAKDWSRTNASSGGPQGAEHQRERPGGAAS